MSESTSTVSSVRAQISDTSYGIGNWTKVLACLHSAQADLPVISKNAANPHRQSRYADLAAIVTGIRPVLAKHGLAFTQPWAVVNGKVRVSTMLFDKDGNIFGQDGELPLASDRAGPQEIGSLVSYGRRYGLVALISAVTADEDDDAQSAHQAHEDRSSVETEVQNLCQAFSKLHGNGGDDAAKNLIREQTGKTLLREASVDELIKLRAELQRHISQSVRPSRRRSTGAAAA